MKVAAVAHESWLLLKRDRIFFPTAIAGVLIALFAGMASDWGIEEFQKILFDVGYTGFLLVGSAVALFWGSRTVSDSTSEGSLEIPFSTPISRPSWLLGRFLGLALVLLFMGCLLVFALQVAMLIAGFGVMHARFLVMFLLVFQSWLVTAALATFFSCFSGQTVALFCSICLWYVGLVSDVVAKSLPQKTEPFVRSVVENLATYWNLQRFDLGYLAQYQTELPTATELIFRAGYGFACIGCFLCMACLALSRRDIIR